MNSLKNFQFIKSNADLVTTREETRAGFLSFALEKNRRSTPYIERAKALKVLASQAKTPKDLKSISDIKPHLLTASGLSDKALNHLEEKDKDNAIDELIENFLEPAGNGFIDELVYRYILIQGDSLGGTMRNIVGAIAQQKLTRAILSALHIAGATYKWADAREKNLVWNDAPEEDYEIETYLKAISWTHKGKSNTLIYNLTVPVVGKNVDICIFEGNYKNFDKPSITRADIIKNTSKYVLLGELKGGIDPAGADEHWKTANTALIRIRESFAKQNLSPKTIFIGAAIENSMAQEIWKQLNDNTLDFAANLTKDNQVMDLCNWLVRL